jgi:hypothetical protein
MSAENFVAKSERKRGLNHHRCITLANTKALQAKEWGAEAAPKQETRLGDRDSQDIEEELEERRHFKSSIVVE